MENVIIKFTPDISAMQPAVELLRLIGKISDEDAAAFAKVNTEQKEFIQNLNKSTTEFGKLNSQVEGLMAEIQAGVMEGFADHLAEVTKETKQAGTSFKSMKQELKELKAQIASGSLGEKELRDATKRAAELQDKIGDVNDKVKALASDTKRIDAVVTAFRGFAAAASVAAGAASLFGAENEKLTRTLAQAQGAMALLQGVQELANIATTEGALKTMVLDGAQKAVAVSARVMGVSIAQATAIATGGLTLLTAGLAYLVTEMMFAEDESEKLQKRLNALAGNATSAKNQTDLMVGLIKDRKQQELTALKVAYEREKLELRKSQADGVMIEKETTLLHKKYLQDVAAVNDKYQQEEADKLKAHRQHLAQLKRAADDKDLQEQLRQIRDEIANNEILMRETSDPSAKIKYFSEITRLKQAQITLDKSLTENEKILQRDLLNDLNRQYQESYNKREEMEIESGELRLEAGLDWWERYFEIEDSFNKQLLEKRKQAAQEWGKFAIDQAQVVSNAVFQINAENTRYELDSKLAAIAELKDAELSNKELTDAQRLQIEKRYQLEEAKIKQQAWEAQKQADLAQAIINGALAVSKAWATVPPPANIPAAIAAGVATSAQVAVIQNTKPPKFEKGGLVDGNLHVSGGTIIEAEKGEYVVNRHSTAEYLPTLKAINEGAVEPTFANNIIASLANGSYQLASQFYAKNTASQEVINYNKLAQVMERNKSIVNLSIDENGLNKWVQKSNSRTNIRNAKLRLRV